MKQTTFVVLFCIISIFSCQQNNTDELLPEKMAGRAKPKSQNHYLLVHGAWHPEAVWAKLKLGLEKDGHEVKTVQLPGLGIDCTPNADITLQTHVDAVKNVLNTFTEPVILLGHSYAGVVISEVGEQMPQKIKKLVYLSAFMLKDGECLSEIALQDVNSVVTQNVIVSPPDVILPAQFYAEAFYNYTLGNSNPDLDEHVAWVSTLLKPHPLSTFTTKVNLGTNYAGLDKVFIRCPDDNAITIGIQDFMIARYPETEIETIPNADHSPFVSRPQQLLNILKKL